MPGDSVEVVLPVAVGHERTEGEAIADVVAIAKNGREVPLIEGGEIRALASRDDEIGDIVLDHIGTDGVVALLAGELEAPCGFAHHPGVDRVEGRVEEVGALHEERAGVRGRRWRRGG